MSDPFKTNEIFLSHSDAKKARIRRDKLIGKKDREIQSLKNENAILKMELSKARAFLEILRSGENSLDSPDK